MNTTKKSFDPEGTRTGTLQIGDGKKSTENIDTHKILEIFESPYTDQLYDRKASYILKFCKIRKDGFFYEEIPNLTRIIEYAIRDLNEGAVNIVKS
jgi:hypothetical protein